MIIFNAGSAGGVIKGLERNNPLPVNIFNRTLCTGLKILNLMSLSLSLGPGGLVLLLEVIWSFLYLKAPLPLSIDPADLPG